MLSTAAYFGNVEIIRYFKDELKFDDINPLDSTKTFTPMMYAAFIGKVDVIKYYLETEKEEVWNRASSQLQGGP